MASKGLYLSEETHKTLLAVVSNCSYQMQTPQSATYVVQKVLQCSFVDCYNIIVVANFLFIIQNGIITTKTPLWTPWLSA